MTDNSFDTLIQSIQETVSQTIRDEIPDIVSHNIFSLLGAAWQSGYSARDVNIQWYIDRAKEVQDYAVGLQNTVASQTSRIEQLELQVEHLVRERVATNG